MDVQQYRKILNKKLGGYILCEYGQLYGHSIRLYRGEDCIKTFSCFLREHAANIITFEKKKMLPLTEKELRLHQDATECYICGKRFSKKFTEDEKYQKVRNIHHFPGKYRHAAHSICILRFNMPNKIPLVFHNGSS